MSSRDRFLLVLVLIVSVIVMELYERDVFNVVWKFIKVKHEVSWSVYIDKSDSRDNISDEIHE